MTWMIWYPHGLDTSICDILDWGTIFRQTREICMDSGCIAITYILASGGVHLWIEPLFAFLTCYIQKLLCRSLEVGKGERDSFAGSIPEKARIIFIRWALPTSTNPMFHCVFSNIYTTCDPNGKGVIHGADLFHDIVLEQIEGSGIGTSNLFDGHFQPKFQGWRVTVIITRVKTRTTWETMMKMETIIISE